MIISPDNPTAHISLGRFLAPPAKEDPARAPPKKLGDALCYLLDKQSSLEEFKKRREADPKHSVDTDVGVTALHKTALSNRGDVARWLISEGAEVNKADPMGCTAMHYAGRHKHAMHRGCKTSFCSRTIPSGLANCACMCEIYTRTICTCVVHNDSQEIVEILFENVRCCVRCGRVC